MSLIYGVIALCIILILVVGTHEFGHYWVAKKFGVGIRQFVLGLGKPLYKKKLSNGIDFGITPFPIGGYVKLYDEREEKLTDSELPKSFNRQPAIKRILILLAGPVINLILAFLLFFIMYLVGKSVVLPIVGEVAPFSIASQAGLSQGDQLLSVDDWETPDWHLAAMAIVAHSGNSAPIQLKIRNSSGELSLVSLQVEQWRYNGIEKNLLEGLGIVINHPLQKSVIKLSLLKAIKVSAYRLWQYIALNGVVVGKILSGKISVAALSGPLTFFDSAQSVLRLGMDKFLYFIALLSIAVGIANLLPLPTLDGGHIMYVLIEIVRGKAVSTEMQVLMYRFMLAAFFVLFMNLLANDLRRLGEKYHPASNSTSAQILKTTESDSMGSADKKPEAAGK